MPVNKVFDSFDEAVKDIFDGAIILIGGFGDWGGCPTWLIRALGRQGAKNLTVAGNNPAGIFGAETREMIAKMRVMQWPDWFEDGSVLVRNGQIKHAICSYGFSPSPLVKTEFEKALGEGKCTVEIAPQGTVAERCRAAKMGIAAFYTPTGVGTVVEKGKEVREFDGRKYVLEHAIKADFSLIRAYKADRRGNLVYRGTSRTFNAVFAGAAKVNIAEVDEVVELGELNPEAIVTPGIWVDRVVARPKEGWKQKVQKW